MSLTDGGIQPTMPVQPANNYGGGMGMWGDNWIWIIVLFLFGWGRNGNGWGGNGSGGVMDGYVLTSDFASVERKLDSIANGVCPEQCHYRRLCYDHAGPQQRFPERRAFSL